MQHYLEIPLHVKQANCMRFSESWLQLQITHLMISFLQLFHLALYRNASQTPYEAEMLLEKKTEKSIVYQFLMH